MIKKSQQKAQTPRRRECDLTRTGRVGSGQCRVGSDDMKSSRAGSGQEKGKKKKKGIKYKRMVLKKRKKNKKK